MRTIVAIATVVVAAILAPMANTQAQPTPVALNASAAKELQSAAGEGSMLPVSGAPLLSQPIYSDIESPRAASAWATFAAGPDSSIAWVFAIGFLGVVALRRTRGW